MSSDFDPNELDKFLSEAEDLKVGPGEETSKQPLHQRDSIRRSLFFAGLKPQQPVPAGQAPPASQASGQQPPQRQRRGMFTGRTPAGSPPASNAANPSQTPGGPASSPPNSSGGSATKSPPTGNGAAAPVPEIPIESDSSAPGLGSMIRIACSCGNRLRIKPNRAGQTINCPKCEKPIKVPDVAKPEQSAVVAAFPKQLTAIVESLGKELANLPPKKTLNYFAFRALKGIVASYIKGKGTIEAVRRAIDELGASGDSRALPVLKSLWELDRDPLRTPLLAAIGSSRDPQALPFLLERLTSPLSDVRMTSAQALGAVEDPRAVRPLMLFGQFDPKHKFAVGDAILKIGAPAERELIALLDQRDDQLVADAVVMLGRLQAGNSVRPLVELLTNGRAGAARGQVAEALGLLGDERAISVLIPLVADSDEKVRVLAATALSRIPHAQSLSALMQGLGDSNLEVRKRCAMALGELGDVRASVALVPLLADPSQELRINVAEALGRIGDERALPALVKMLRDPDEAVVLKSVTALRKIKNPEAIPSLLGLLTHENARIRQRSVDALGQLGDGFVAERLEVILKNDRSEDVRAAAAKSLGEIKDPGSVDALVHATTDAFAVRCKAIVSLGEIGDETTVPLLISLLKDPVPEARYHAALALGEMQSRTAVSQIEALLIDTNPMVRRGAAKALEKLGLGDADTLAKGLGQRSLVRGGQGLSRILSALAPDAILGAITGGSVMQRGIVAAVLLLPLAAIGGYYYFTGPAAAPEVFVVRGFVSALDFDSRDQRVIVGRTGGIVEIYDAGSKSRVEMIQISEAASGILAIKFAPDGQQFVMASSSVAGGYNLSGKSLWSVSGHGGHFVELKATKDRSRVLVRSSDGIISFWKLPEGTQIGAPIKLPADKLNATGLSPDAKLIAGAGTKGPISVWKTDTGELVTEVTGLAGQVLSIAFSPDSTMLAAATTSGEIGLWSRSTGKLIAQYTPETPGSLSNLTFSKDGQQLFGIFKGAMVGRFVIAEKTFESFAIKGLGQANTLAVSSDATKVSIGGEENTAAVIYDLAKQETIAELDVKQ